MCLARGIFCSGVHFHLGAGVLLGSLEVSI